MSSYLDLTIEGAPPAPSCINDSKPVTVPFVRAQKGKEKLTMLTAYDYPTARLLDESGIDMLLIGDSVATVLYGEDNTLAVTMEDMLRHVKAVSRGTRRALVIADMPFMSYQVSIEQALTNAGRLLKEAGAHAIKLEGGEEMADTIRASPALAFPSSPILALPRRVSERKERIACTGNLPKNSRCCWMPLAQSNAPALSAWCLSA